MKASDVSAKVAALIFALILAGISARAQPISLLGPATFTNNDAFLEYVEQETFNYFWNEANPTNGLIHLRSDGPQAAISAIGFGLSAICVAIDEGWITRDEGSARVLTTLQTLYNAPQGSGASGFAGYHGWFYHQLDINTGLRYGTSELSSSDTTLLMLGVIDAGIYFNDPSNADEVQIQTLSSNLFNRVDYQFMLNTNNNTVYLQWTPEMGFTNVGGYIGYNQTADLYILGLGATNNPLPAASWNAWVSGFHWDTYYGFSYAFIPQLFCYQYSHCWIDFRGITDAYMLAKGSDYFQNSREATLAQQAYAMANPDGYPNYGSNEWGFTSCSTPAGYVTCGAPAGTDNGTIAPTAAAGSMPFAPEVCLPTLLHMYDTYTNKLWTTEGFRDSYNISSNDWFCPNTLAIDEGPIVLMIENYRTGSVWNRMMSSPIVQRGLQRADFAAPPTNAMTTSRVIPFYEPFNYPAGTQLQGQGGWVTNSVVSEVGLVAPGNLTIPYAPSPIGNHYNWSNSVTDRLPFGIQTNGSIYFSFAYRVETIGSSRGEDTFAGLALSNSTTLYPKIDAFLAGPDDYQIGVAKGSGLNGNVGTNGTVFTTNDTVFIVACLNMFSNDTNGDTVDLWVNPDPATYGAAVPPGPSVANIDGSPDPPGGIDRISLRGGGASSSPQSQDVDELRVGYTWASVTPPTPVFLESSINDNDVVVTWPTNGVGWSLSTTTNLATGPWVPVLPIIVIGTNNMFTGSAAFQQQFFRLTR